MVQDRQFRAARSTEIWDLLIWFFGAALLALLVVSYATGEQYPDTYEVIGYTIAIVIGANVFWMIVSARAGRVSPMKYTPSLVMERFHDADRLTKTITFAVLILAALPFSAVLIMLFTHVVWGTTNIDEMHHVVAWFALRLVALYVVLVIIASTGYIEARFRSAAGRK